MEGKKKVGIHGGGEAEAEAAAATLKVPASWSRTVQQRHRSSSSSSSSTKPSWLLLTIADMDERMKMLKVEDMSGKVGTSDNFGKRAEAYYQQRPHLHALLQDLYNAYLSLADRYTQALSKNHHRRRFPSPISPLYFDQCEPFDAEESGDGRVTDSDAESSLSYQPAHARLDADMLIADLVIKNVESEIAASELDSLEARWDESSRKTELQKSLLDVLECERVILLSENATLNYRLNALMEENKGLVSESLFVKRRAAELAQCMVKMREDQRVCALSRKIEDLQGQIYVLEKNNKECYAQLAKQHKAAEAKLKKAKKLDGEKKSGLKMWEKVKKNLDFFLCGPQYNSAYC